MEADFVIVGAGSAGCAMAYRLSEDGANSVLVIEFGGTDVGPFIQMPAALSYPMNMSLYNWGFESEPEPHLGGRRMHVPRGKVIGGSSSINGMCYVRGHAQDYNHWQEMGATGWGYKDVLPYFKRMESWHDNGKGGDPSWRGTDGPLHVKRGDMKNPLYQAFIDAGRQAGYETTADYNGEKQEGFSPFDMTVHNGRRWSAANAYLHPATARGNCDVVKAYARRIVIEEGRATGVEIERGGKIEVVKARREVIIAASSLNSPKLLMISGVGPASEISQHGVEVVVDRPGVGKNLQNHLELYIQQACKLPITLYKHWNLFSKGLIGAQWLFTKTGMGTSNQFEACAFVRSDAGIDYPDIQYHFLPMAIKYDGTIPAAGHGFQAHVGPMRSQSRGEVTLRSGDPLDKPVIRFNYMDSEKDWADFRKCIRMTREIFAQEAFAPYAAGEIQPGPDCQTDDELNDFVRQNVESAYHPSCSAKMGAKDDPMAVVDPECRVIGVDNLRLADSSIFPRITNGNLNAPSIMVGEKASDHILGKTPLPAANIEPWIHPDWKKSQR